MAMLDYINVSRLYWMSLVLDVGCKIPHSRRRVLMRAAKQRDEAWECMTMNYTATKPILLAFIENQCKHCTHITCTKVNYPI
jgi:hypothetical protein